jgi:hypothetical protein
LESEYLVFFWYFATITITPDGFRGETPFTLLALESSPEEE